MSLNDPLSNALVNIKNHENAAKRQCSVAPVSKLIGSILEVLKENGYIESFEKEGDDVKRSFRVSLGGTINECRAIKPRYAVKKDSFEKYEKRYLPSRDMGILVVSTSQGIFSHREAKKKNIGGRLLAFVY